MKYKIVFLVTVINITLLTPPTLSQIRPSRGGRTLLNDRYRIRHNRTNWSLNVPGRISNPYELRKVTLYPSIRGDLEQQWYGGRWAGGVPDFSLSTGAGSYADSCLNSIRGISGEAVTTFKCDGGDKFQNFVGVPVVGGNQNTAGNYLIKLGTGRIERSLCLEPDLGSQGYFYANMNVVYQRCNATDQNQWFRLDNWK